MDPTAWSAEVMASHQTVAVNEVLPASFAKPIPHVSRLYVPKANGGYANTKPGSVGLVFWMGAFKEPDQAGFYFISKVTEYLVGNGHTPYFINVYLDFPDGPNTVVLDIARELKENIVPALVANYPNISPDPAYRVIAGQSTSGVNAFDVAWMRTDVVSKVLGGSPSFACFACLGFMDNDSWTSEIKFCPPRAIRFSGSVGTCDIFSSPDERKAAGCCDPNAAAGTPESCANVDGFAVDRSPCMQSWIKVNQDVAAALAAKGTPYQLFVVPKGTHSYSTWSAALAQRLRFLFADVTCY